MKRYIAILAAALLLACTACGKKQAPSDTLDSEGPGYGLHAGDDL